MHAVIIQVKSVKQNFEVRLQQNFVEHANTAIATLK
jgi:hypothetical protein